MNRKWIGVAFVAAGVTVGCGQGRMIFNVDVYSWVKGSPKDTIPYAAPPLSSNVTASGTPQKISLPPGLGSSSVDTVKVSGTVTYLNQSGGPGTIAFQAYVAADSAGTYAPASRDSLINPVPTATVSGTNTTGPVPFGIPNLSPKGDSLFAKSQVWVRLVATVSNSSASFLQGQAVLTALDVRVVMQDKIF